ncbi:UDP-glycosyltransferase 86A1-like [Andrographis paniculata]|uniref:UDP-glycosyltransferase 86A1-like n=1 Tax=Andrographis paniculata TaxID=175694 RepID=UPI0021E91493|nr:UDP-glycosyltransferase 86A1-like [Andrographis paniculata]
MAAAKPHPQPQPHAIMIPYPYQGHINPFVSLAVKLASNGFTITFVNTQSVHSRISRARGTNAVDIFAGARASGLDIRYATVSDGFPLGFDRSANHDQFVEGLIHVFSAHVDELVADLSESDSPLTILIADTFYVWASAIARKHSLLCVSFWTEPALVLSLYYHLHLLKKHGHFHSKEKRKDTIDYIPGVKAIKPTDLTSYLQTDDVTTVVHRVIYRAFEDVKKADIIICNTVEDLESDTLSALNTEQPTYAIGPIVSNFTSQTLTTSLWSESDFTEWLNTKPKRSVLYVSFGSHAHTTSKQDILEIAYGLQISGVNFVWVIRPDIVSSDETNVLPEGFEESINGRGLIVQWCRQTKVISHPAIGGFLSHCGWNSVLESIWCRVPLLCFPLFTDQFTNRKLVVNDWKIGINLCDRETITREEVEEKIKDLMSGGRSEQLRNAVREVSGTMEKALTSEGSSEKRLKMFMEDMKCKIKKKALAASKVVVVGGGVQDQGGRSSSSHVWASTPAAVNNLCQQIS